MAPTQQISGELRPSRIHVSFKERKSLATRRSEMTSIRRKFPTKVPVNDLWFTNENGQTVNLVYKRANSLAQWQCHSNAVIVERYKDEKCLPFLDKTKYLVPQELTLGQFSTLLRNRMRVGSARAVYFTINRKYLPNMSMVMSEVYREHIDEDGFLYITYASEEMFG